MPGIFYASPCMHLLVQISRYLLNVEGLQHLADCVLLIPRGHELLLLLNSNGRNRKAPVILVCSYLMIVIWVKISPVDHEEFHYLGEPCLHSFAAVTSLRAVESKQDFQALQMHGACYPNYLQYSLSLPKKMPFEINYLIFRLEREPQLRPL